MRAIIKNNNDTALDISIQRSAADTLADAYDLTREIAAALASSPLAPATVELSSIPNPGDPIVISLSLPIETRLLSRLRSDGVQTDYARAVAVPQDPRARGELVARIEDVIAQYLTRIDAIRAVGWCLQDIRDHRADLFWQEQVPLSQITTLEEEFVVARAELIAPYIEGKYPVRQTELFAEFHQLPLLEQQIIVATGPSPQVSESILNGQKYSTSLLPDSERTALWTQMSARLLQAHWLVAVPPPRWAGGGGLWLGRGQKSRLLPSSQMITV